MKMISRMLLLGGLLSLVLAPLQAVGAQVSGAQIRITQVDTSGFPKVTVYVSVTNASGEPQPVNPNQIQIYENGQMMQPEQVSASGAIGPLTTLLVMDVSGSMYDSGKLTAAKEAAQAYVEQMRPGDQAGLLTFNTTVTYRQAITTDRNALIQAIDGLHAQGDTAMFDALAQAARILEPASGRKAIIVLTDGLDNLSKTTPDAVIQSIDAAGLSISTIGLGDPSKLGINSGLDEAVLQSLAARAGGAYGYANDPNSLKGLYEKYGRALQSEYSMTYNSTSGLRDGLNRSLTVSLANYSSAQAGYNPGGLLPEVARRGSWPVFILLLVILAFQVALGAGYAVGTPAWEAPDEPAHYNYIRFVAENAAFPVIQTGDYDAAELERLKAARFPASMSVDGVRYENHQPPLYYVLVAPLFKASAGLPVAQQVVVLRLASVLLGALVLLAAYAIARVLFPANPLTALAAPAFLAVIPMHTAMSAAINNDTLSELLLAIILLLSLLRLQDRLPARRYVLLAGVVYGLGLLTKVTVYVGAGVYAGAELARWWMARRERPVALARQALTDGVKTLAGAAAVGLALGGWWFVRNALVYGNLDILARQRHDLVVVGQPRTVWGWEALQHFAITTFHSFWAQFGWMGIPVDQRIYDGLAVLMVMAAAGLGLYMSSCFPRLAPVQKWGLRLAALLFVLIFAGMAQYNLDYIQPQGRYLFPAAVAVALALSLGLEELAGRALCTLLLIAGVAWLATQGAGRVATAFGAGLVLFLLAVRWRAPRASAPVVVGGAVAALAALDVYCLVGVILPYFR